MIEVWDDNEGDEPLFIGRGERMLDDLESTFVNDLKSDDSKYTIPLFTGGVEPEKAGEVTMRMYFVLPGVGGQLDLENISANVKKAGKFKDKADPYCVVRVGDQMQQTQIDEFAGKKPRWPEAKMSFNLP